MNSPRVRSASSRRAAEISREFPRLSTFVTLYDYGYRNVYELGPNVKLEASQLPFEGTLAKNRSELFNPPTAPGVASAQAAD